MMTLFRKLRATLAFDKIILTLYDNKSRSVQDFPYIRCSGYIPSIPETSTMKFVTINNCGTPTSQ